MGFPEPSGRVGVLCKDMLFKTKLDFSLRVFNYIELKNVEGGRVGIHS